MTASVRAVYHSYADYLAFETASNVKHEYLGGQIYGMAGGSPAHAALTTAVVGLLFPQLMKGPCRAFSADLRVRVQPIDLATYPDVAIVCGSRQHAVDDPHAVTNPRAIVEVLSPSTEAYDRGDKFDHYKHIPSLRHYMLLSPAERRIEVWTRDDNHNEWTRQLAGAGEVAELPAIGCKLDVDALYAAAAEPA